MELNIKHTDGRWLVNGKRLDELNSQERQFMNDFFREVKIKGMQPEEALIP